MKEIVDQTIGSVLDPSPDFNGFKNEVQNAIISGGISLSEADVNQLGKSIANYVGNADYYACTGSANTYTLSRVGLFKEPSGYFTGMRIRFRPNVSNTGASTVNIVGLGVKDLKRTDGTTDFASGELSNLYDYEFTYNGTVFSLQSQGVIEGKDILAVNLITSGLSKIKGITDGSPVAAGYVGEVVEYKTTTDVVGSTTLGTYTDVIANCILTAGIWEIDVIAECYLDVGTTGGIGIIALALTDNSNNIIREFYGSSVEALTGYTNITRSTIPIKYIANITTSTTYKVRFAPINETGGPVINNLSVHGTATHPAIFIAKRIG